MYSSKAKSFPSDRSLRALFLRIFWYYAKPKPGCNFKISLVTYVVNNANALKLEYKLKVYGFFFCNKFCLKCLCSANIRIACIVLSREININCCCLYCEWNVLIFALMCL